MNQNLSKELVVMMKEYQQLLSHLPYSVLQNVENPSVATVYKSQSYLSSGRIEKRDEEGWICPASNLMPTIRRNGGVQLSGYA